MNNSRRVDVRSSIYALESYRIASGEPLAIGGISASLVGERKRTVANPPVAVLRQQADPPYRDWAFGASGGQEERSGNLSEPL
jgi:hypothetical protein